MTMLRSIAMLAVFAVAIAAANAAPDGDRRVVVITLDGFPAYLLDDPHASLPVIRGLRRAGAFAIQGMRVSNPAVTWPNHTTLMTGVHPEKHGVLFNGVLERHGKGQTVRVEAGKSQQDLVRIPLLFDHLKAAGVDSTAINWPCTRGSASIDANLPDVPDQVTHTSEWLKDVLDREGHLARFVGGSNVVRDEVWTDAACRVIRDRKPRFLTLHLLNLDSTHHKYGPRSNPGYTAAALLDAMVGRVIEALTEAGIRDKTAVFILADHGFMTVKHSLHPNAVLRKEGLLTMQGASIATARVQVVPEGGIGMVYLNDPGTADADGETVRRLFRDAEGIRAVLGPEDFGRYHFPMPKDNPQMADLVLVAKEGYSFTASAAGDKLVGEAETPFGAHGYVSTEPGMNALFVASGSGIRPGVRLKVIDNVDIAPTAANLLGLKLEGVGGRVLGEILEGHD
ncbi:Type I phosphodiesterase / nucleotide pyrophosphatase [Aquisphaera giovannonii]|uniref:Type I phosphodiesterase / nucleotide pyrophosphatase n=1 Tax=Aquisphaera giovannonii TaxID=406548 RepID=A0A5B9WBL3_9BACT|nr:nucleotide pyrophosphatase/phosphodiesterase family protein [Aquisphaera giovannonii]QEH37270.1 Type I phosphodiesterase / nucleotide pyrophosphatase [Aquisphaera giovannonii]